MKNLVVTLLVICISVSVYAQNNAIDTYFSSYQASDEVTKVSVTGKMFSLFTEFDGETEDEKAVLEAISKLKGIKAVIKKDAADGLKEYAAAMKIMDADSNYEELMSVEDVDEFVRFMIRDNNGTINELLMVRGAKREFMVMTLFGEIDLSTIGRLSRIMKIGGLERFEMIDKHKHHDKN